jgi:LysR family carnitine catabolism transcriptional activator
MIQKLESALGARLFERDTRNVTLTPEGELFAEVARTLIEDIDSAFSNMNDYVMQRKGRVAIAALPSLAAGHLPAVIAEYTSMHHGITIELFDVLSDQCLNLLRQGKVDFALTAPQPALTEFDTFPLCSDPFYLVCRSDHRLAKKRWIQPRDLAGCDLIPLARSTSVRQHVDVILHEVDVKFSSMQVEHLATAAGLIEHGLGVTIVPELTLFQFRNMNLVAIPLKDADQTRPIMLVRAKDRSLSIAARSMLDLIKERLKHIGRYRASIPESPF